MELKLFKAINPANWFELLIVPYGIETKFLLLQNNLLYSFNRTLWN